MALSFTGTLKEAPVAAKKCCACSQLQKFGLFCALVVLTIAITSIYWHRVLHEEQVKYLYDAKIEANRACNDHIHRQRKLDIDCSGRTRKSMAKRENLLIGMFIQKLFLGDSNWLPKCEEASVNGGIPY